MSAVPLVAHLDTEEQAEQLARELLDPERERPVVVVSTHPGSSAAWIDADALAWELLDRARVVVLETGPASWALTDALPARLDVYGGAFRLYAPGLDAQASIHEHPLFLPRSQPEAERAVRRLLARFDHLEAWSDAGRHQDPAAWARVAACYAEGDVVLGRVERFVTHGVLVALLPGAVGHVHKADVDHHYVEDAADFVRPGQRVKVRILSLEPELGRARLSIKDAFLAEPRPGIGLTDDDPPFVDDVDPVAGAAPSGGDAPRASAAPAGADPDTSEPDPLETLRHELEQSENDRRAQAAKLGELRRELRSTRDKLEHLERGQAGDLQPDASPDAFLCAVRVLHARTFGEGDRRRHPLRTMRVGPEFMERMRGQLAHVALAKVVEVCMQVACGQAHAIHAREVHQLRTGPAGSPSRRRERDGAQAWRCSLQDNTPAARRLHWWSGSGPDGEWVEFAHVGVHDDMSIPE